MNMCQRFLFNLFFNEGTNKMLQLVQRKSKEQTHIQAVNWSISIGKQPTVFLIDKFHFCRQESSANFSIVQFKELK